MDAFFSGDAAWHAGGISLEIQPPLRAAFSLPSSIASTKEGIYDTLQVYGCISPHNKPDSQHTQLPGVCSQNSQNSGSPGHLCCCILIFSAVLELPMPGKTAFAEFPWSPAFLPWPELDQIISLPHFGDKAGAEQTCHYLCFNFSLQVVWSQCLSAQISSSYHRDNNWLTNQHNSSITPSNLLGGFCKWLKNRSKSLAGGLIGTKSRQYLTVCFNKKKSFKNQNTLCV